MPFIQLLFVNTVLSTRNICQCYQCMDRMASEWDSRRRHSVLSKWQCLTLTCYWGNCSDWRGCRGMKMIQSTAVRRPRQLMTDAAEMHLRPSVVSGELARWQTHREYTLCPYLTQFLASTAVESVSQMHHTQDWSLGGITVGHMVVLTGGGGFQPQITLLRWDQSPSMDQSPGIIQWY